MGKACPARLLTWGGWNLPMTSTFLELCLSWGQWNGLGGRDRWGLGRVVPGHQQSWGNHPQPAGHLLVRAPCAQVFVAQLGGVLRTELGTTEAREPQCFRQAARSLRQSMRETGRWGPDRPQSVLKGVAATHLQAITSRFPSFHEKPEIRISERSDTQLVTRNL